MQQCLKLTVLCISSLLLIACQQVGGQLTYHPPVVPLKISVNTWGEIDIEASGEIVTPLGTFEVGVVAQPDQFFDGVENTLTILIDDEACYYGLSDQNFEVELEPGQYDKIALRQENGNIFLELDGPGYTGCSQRPVTSVLGKVHGNDIVCEGASPSSLAIGDQAYISVFQAAVHQSPGESTPLVRNKYLARDRVVTIVDGPVCAERVLFWKVRSEEINFAGGGHGIIVGWVGEESGDIYLLRPFQ